MINMNFMKFNISNKEFYSRHNKELEKYLIGEKSLHLLNIKSKRKIKKNNSKIIYLELESDYLSVLNEIKEKYSTIVITDIVELTQDLYLVFKKIDEKLLPNGKLVISSLNTKWGMFIKFLEFLNIKDKNQKYSYIHVKKIQNITNSLGLEFIKSNTRQFIPFKIFGIGNLLNSFLEIIFSNFNFGIKTYFVFRKKLKKKSQLSRCILIPAKNEEGNLMPLFERIPNKEITQFIFSIGKSKDKTLEKANEIKNLNPSLKIKVFEQSKTGKANAVWESFEYVNADLVAILDADISVEPETMDDFFEILENNNSDFVNGTRLVYEMERDAMRYINKKGNILFQFIVSFIIGKKLTDSLCGTKVFKKEFMEKVIWWQEKYKLKDPFGDFDLIFTASITGEKIAEYPVHYKSRIYGSTQIKRFRDGFKLIIYLLRSFLIFNSSKY